MRYNFFFSCSKTAAKWAWIIIITREIKNMKKKETNNLIIVFMEENSKRHERWNEIIKEAETSKACTYPRNKFQGQLFEKKRKKTVRCWRSLRACTQNIFKKCLLLLPNTFYLPFFYWAPVSKTAVNCSTCFFIANQKKRIK